MIEVKRYKCEICGKEFRTPNKHRCKYDPKFKNCFSCKHNKGFEQESHYNGQIDIFLECAAKDDTIDAREARTIECGYYEYCGGKWFENEYNKKDVNE